MENNEIKVAELPKFKKIELIMRVGTFSTDKFTFNNAGFIIHGNNMVIEMEDGDTTIGVIHNLDTIIKYKTYK